MPKNNFVTELVNAFNLRNYYFDDVNTNFTVKGNKIVGLFASNVEVKKYFQAVRKGIIKRHYDTEEAAGEYYKLDYFPFVFDVNSKWKAKGRAIREVELADSTNNEVIRNLKIYFAKEFQRVVEAKVMKNLETSARMTEKKTCECLEGSVLEEIDRYSPYLYCISFNGRYFKESGYPPRFFEAFRGMYISAFDLKLEEYGFNDSSIFYEQRDNKLYIRDITNINVVKNVAKHVRGRIALDFKTPGTEDYKVGNFKDVLRDLVFKKVGKPINAYDYGVFIDEKQRKNGHSFALIPLEERKYDEFYSLGLIDAIKIDPNVLNLFKNSNISNVVGKIANPQFANCKGSVYAFSNKQIAQLLPKIMEYPIAYNKINGRFEFAVDLENFKRRGSSRSSSTVNSPLNSPTHAGPSGLRTPPNQRDRDSGYDSNSPPKPKDSGSSSGGPSSGLTELSSPTQEFPKQGRSQDGVLGESPRQWSEREEEAGRMFQLVPGEIDPSQSTGDQSQLSLGAGEGMLTEDNIQGQKRLSSIPSPIAWNDSTFLNPEVSEDSLKDTENICNEEQKEQKVIGKSDRKSSDECSEAKPQKNESPEKQHGGGWRCSKRNSDGVTSLFRQNNKGRGSVYSISSSVSAPGSPVTKKSSVSKLFSSLPARIRARSNPSSAVTSPTHEGASGGLKPLTSDERKELRLFLSPELRKKLDFNSLSPEDEQLKHLLYTPSGQEKMKKNFESQEENLRRSVNAQLPANSSSKKVDRDSGFCSMGSPAVQHKGSVPSEVKECEVEPVSEALRK